MFSKNKVSQSMIDAVNQVVETAPIKEPTPTGMRVFGGSYGNSAKAKKDQTKSAVDNLKGPKAKEMKEAAKPDFLDMDGDKNEKESMKKAIADKKSVKEELKGNQHKIDANNNNKIDAQDFKILKSKKKVSEGMHFAGKLLEAVRKSDVPAYLRKAKGDTPLTMADVKAPKKDSISAPENLAKARNEEVELDESLMSHIEVKPARKHKDPEILAVHDVHYKGKKIGDIEVYHHRSGMKYGSSHDATGNSTAGHRTMDQAIDDIRQEHAQHLKSMKEEVEHLNEDDFAHAKKQGWSVSQHYHHTKVTHPKHGIVSVDRYGEWMHHPDQDYLGRPKGDLVAHGQFDKLNKHLSSLKEEVELDEEHYKQPDDAPITTDTLAGRIPGGKMNSFKSYKLRVRPLDKEEQRLGDNTPAIVQPQKTPAMKSHEVHEATIAGTSGWEPIKKDTKDKSGAVHTPMSRARDLAKSALKRVQDKTKIK